VNELDREVSMLRKIMIMVVLFLAAITVVSFLLLHYKWKQPIDWGFIIQFFLAAILPTLFINVFLKYYTDIYSMHITRQVVQQAIIDKSDDILETLLHHVDHVDRFSTKVRVEFLDCILISLLGHQKSIVAKSAIDPYLSNAFGLWSSYNLSVQLMEVQKDWSIFSSRNYMRIWQNVTYRKDYDNSQPPIDDICLRFQLNLQAVDQAYLSEDCIFRELLNIRLEEQDKLIKMSEDQLAHFVQDILQPRITVNGDDLSNSITRIAIDQNGISVFYNGVTPSETQLEYNVSCYVPWQKSTKYFVIALSEPVYSPRIQFQCPDGYKIDYIPYWDQRSGMNVTEGHNQLTLCVPDCWIMPRSGIILIWDDAK